MRSRNGVARRAWWVLVPIAATVWQVRRHWEATPRARLDFHIYYDAVAAMHRMSIYDFKDRIFPLGFTYPPFAACLLRPLVALHEPAAEHTWLLLSAVGTLVFAVMSATLAELPDALDRSVAATMVVLAMPTSLTLRLGQINALIACLLVIDVTLMQRQRRAGGIATGLAAAIKLTPAMVVVSFVTIGRWRDATRAALAALLATSVAAVIRPGDSWRYFTSVVYDTRRVGRGGQFNDSLRRLVDSNLTDGWRLYVGLVVVMLAATFVGVRAAARDGRLLEVVTLTMVCSYLVSPITWGHHLYFVGPAVILLWSRRTVLTRALALVGAVLLLDPFEGGQGEAWASWRIAFMATALVVLAATSGWRVAASRREGRGALPVSAPAAG